MSNMNHGSPPGGAPPGGPFGPHAPGVHGSANVDDDAGARGAAPGTPGSPSHEGFAGQFGSPSAPGVARGYGAASGGYGAASGYGVAPGGYGPPPGGYGAPGYGPPPGGYGASPGNGPRPFAFDMQGTFAPPVEGSLGLGLLAGFFGGCIGLVLVMAIAKGPATKKGVTIGFAAQLVVGVLLRIAAS